MHDRPIVVAIDGGGGAGKSTLARKLTSSLDSSAVVHADDLAWNEPLFEWGHLLRALLLTAHAGDGVDLAPPAWATHGRTGTITVPAGLRLLVVEGTGAGQRAVADLTDVVIWVQADGELAERRALLRDVEQGDSPDAAAAKAFWDEWMAVETPFFSDDRPWDRAWTFAAGIPDIDLTDDEVAVGEPPR